MDRLAPHKILLDYAGIAAESSQCLRGRKWRRPITQSFAILIKSLNGGGGNCPEALLLSAADIPEGGVPFVKRRATPRCLN